MPLLVDPVPAPAARLLRTAVLELRARERRRVFGPVLHVGRPGGRRRSFAARPGEVVDAALRADVVAAMLRHSGPGDPVLAWLTRSGPLSWHDADAAWLEPVVRAFAETGAGASFVVVTRQGWRDPRTGAGREWRRLRPRS